MTIGNTSSTEGSCVWGLWKHLSKPTASVPSLHTQLQPVVDVFERKTLQFSEIEDFVETHLGKSCA